MESTTSARRRHPRQTVATRWTRAIALLAGLLLATALAAVVPADPGSASAVSVGAGGATVWLCRPGLPNDPCTSSLQKTVVEASGASSVVDVRAAANPAFDCFYVYPTVSRELSVNADLRVQKTEIATAVAQASPFSRVCRVYAPIYRQVTLLGLANYPSLNVPASYRQIAYDSLLSGFKDYLAQFNDGRPIIFIGHSQGAAILINLLQQQVDNDAALRSRLVLAVILGGDVEVRTGSVQGGSFSHIPVCSHPAEAGCVIAYSSFPGEPPASALFGRPGQGVALQSGQRAKKGVQVVCVNPAAEEGGASLLDSYFPTEGALPTAWVEFPGLYSARCESAGGASWLQVTKATGHADKRPVVSETAGPDWGYHSDDVNLALGNLVADVAAAEATFTQHRKA